tara:strand:- start:304 stop:549 length:246 start_codon:yes stop_codon:yes gene_type:complete
LRQEIYDNSIIIKNIAQNTKRHLDIVHKETVKNLHVFQKIDWLAAQWDEHITQKFKDPDHEYRTENCLRQQREIRRLWNEV